MNQQEKDQEAAFKQKYGNMKPKKQLIGKESKHFDSADWAMERNNTQRSPPIAKKSSIEDSNSDVSTK